MLVDLHVHTTASDGTYKPEQILEVARQEGIEVISITDHDTIDGLFEVPKSGTFVSFIPGVEISAEYPTTLHILGYGIDPKNKELYSTLDKLRQYRNRRNELMLEKMRNFGFHMEMEELIEEAGGELIGRPHFANLMVKKGYVSNYQEAFDKYLKKGAPLYMDKKRLSPEKAIELIHTAGGIAVLAHPYQAETDPERLEMLVQKLVSYGLDGIEVFYSQHSQAQIEEYLYLAKKYDLLITAGSDFHGENKPDISLGLNVSYGHLKRFLCKVL